jgi:chorismate synthase
MSNSLGKIFKITCFGESHGPSVGVIVDGCPAGVKLDMDYIQLCLDRRKPGQSELTTERKEEDLFQITSGIINGVTTGHPICINIPNKDQRSEDYDDLKEVYRPSHADFTYDKKYGLRDYRGGGRSSARVTATWVAAGAIAAQILREQCKTKVSAYVSQIHDIKLDEGYSTLDLDNRYSTDTRCPDEEVSNKMTQRILEAKSEGDSLGGIISCVVNQVPIGLGDPVFDKLNANLAKAMMSINAVKGFSIGSGFDSVLKKGSELNDSFVDSESGAKTSTNNSGGIQGGISNGMDIHFQVAFKPTATISKEQNTVNSKGQSVKLEASGRHDPCVVPRAVPIVEAMTALVLLDHFLYQKSVKLD